MDVHRKLENVVAICDADAQAKRLTLKVELGATSRCVSGDRARLQQVFWSIVKNAVKFTPEGGTITARTYNASNGHLIVEVIDTGIGIEADVLPRIFEPFEQGGESTTRRFGGLGLGLSISKALTEMHGGKISASSGGSGKGAAFTIELPTIAEHPCSRAAESRRVAEARGMRILLVEDHQSTASLLVRLLQAWDHDVKHAAGVRAAMELAASNRFDLVISDLGLPDGTGLDLMRQIKIRYGLRGIALSGYGMEQDVENSLHAGFDAHLTKPINARHLEDVISQLASRGSLAKRSNSVTADGV